MPSSRGRIPTKNGNFISALAPILDPSTGEVLMVVGIDLESSVYAATLLRAGLLGLLPALVLGAIALGGLSFVWRRERLPLAQQASWKYAEDFRHCAVRAGCHTDRRPSLQCK